MHPDPGLFRYCPRCGSAAFSLENEKPWHCRDCGFTYYTNVSAAVAGLLVDDRGRLLLTRRRHEPEAGSLDLPGGFIDPQESAEEGLRREIREELGIEVTDMTYFTSFPNRYRFGEVTYATLDLAFMIQAVDLDRLAPRDDVAEVLFLARHEIDPEAIGLSSIRRIVGAFLSSTPRKAGAPGRFSPTAPCIEPTNRF